MFKKSFVALAILVLSLIPLPAGAESVFVIPLPFRIGGPVTVNGTPLTQATDTGYVFKVTKEDGITAYIPAAEDTDGLNSSDYYIIDIPIYEPNDQPGGANPGETAVIHVFKDGTELQVTSPTNGQFTVGQSGDTMDMPVSVQMDQQCPTADAGPDQTVQQGTTVVLDGTGSTDPDGDPLAYSWTQTAGPTVNLSNNSEQNPSFIAPNNAQDYTLTFQLVVNDGTCDSSPDMVDIAVNTGNPGIQGKLYFPHVACNGSWETEIGIINSSAAETVDGVLRAYGENGDEISSYSLQLSPNERKQYTVSKDFSNAADIRYFVFEANSGALKGYEKVFVEGKYRAAVPAELGANIGDIHISHIASNDSWWTGIALVNTNSSSKTVTIEFNTGESKTLTIGANAHKAFFIKDLFAGQPRPDIQSALVVNGAGVVGLALFGSETDGNSQLGGVLLRDSTSHRIFFPHFAMGSEWWTGIVFYNTSNVSSTLFLNPYNSAGMFLGSNGVEVESHGKYGGLVRDLNFPTGTAWLDVQSPQLIVSLQAFGTNDGSEYAVFATTDLNKTEGLLPKLEKNGWTGIAFVNTGGSLANVNLTAYDDGGNVIAQETLTLAGHAKIVSFPKNIFKQDISAASYLHFSSSAEIAGFQLNGSSDGNMVDGLQGM